MSQGNDGFSDPTRDPLLDPLRDRVLDPSLDAPHDRWDALRVEDAGRRSGPGEAVFTHGVPGAFDDGSPVRPEESRVGTQGESPRRGDHEPEQQTRERRVPPPRPGELPLIEVSRSAPPARGAAGPARGRRTTRPQPPSGPRASRGVMGTGVPMVVVAFLGLLGVAGVAGLSLADQDEHHADQDVEHAIVGEVMEAHRLAADPNIPFDVTRLPVRLTVPAAPIQIRAGGGEVTVDDEGCSVEAGTSVDRRDVTISCVDSEAPRPIVVTLPVGVPLTVAGGTQLTVTGDLESLAVNGSTADVVVDDLATGALRVATSGEVTGRIRAATDVDVLSRNGRVDLQFDAAVRKTRIQAPRGEVSVEVPGRVAYDLDLRAGKGSVSSAVPDSAGAKDSLAITTGGRHITVTTAP